MRFSTFLPLVLAATASAMPNPKSGYGSSVERRGAPPPAPRNEHQGIAAEHARARRSALAHGGSTLRKVRRKKVKRAGKCRPRTTTSAQPAPTGDWGQNWTKPQEGGDEDEDDKSSSGSSSSGGSSSSEWDNEVDWSGSATTTTSSDKGSKPSSSAEEGSSSSSSSSNEWQSASPSPSASDKDNESALPSPSSSSKDNEWSSSAAPSSTSSSQDSQPTDTNQGGSISGDMTTMLMPLGRGTAAWSTCPTAGGDALSFDEALLPLQWGQLPNVGKAPDGSTCYEQVYPAGTHGKGFSFYFNGDKNGVSIEGAKEVVLGYSVFFKDGFEWTAGGKLPGLYGGTSLEAAKSCSGGRDGTRDDCFSARLMWRDGGAGEIYNYFPPQAQNAYCNVPPKSMCNKNYGDSVARGSFTWATGQWNTVAQRIKLNDPGQKNGEQELFLNGKSIINLKNVEIIIHEGSAFHGVMAQSFFGGSSDDYNPSSDQTAWFKDWTLSVIQ